MRQFIFAAVMLVFLSLPEQVLSQSTRGTDFLISFNELQTGAPTPMMKIVASEATSVAFIYNGISGSNKTVFIPAGSIFHYTFSNAEQAALSTGTASQNLNNTLRLHANKPISVYILNATSNNADATLVLPISSWGTTYRHLSYTPGSRGDAYLIIAAEDGTNIYRAGYATNYWRQKSRQKIIRFTW